MNTGRSSAHPPVGVHRSCSATGCCSASTSAQYCITTLTYFFLTWFPVYLVEQRGMSILKAGLRRVASGHLRLSRRRAGRRALGSPLQDRLSLTLRARFRSSLGMLMSMSMVLCNYVDAHGRRRHHGAAFFGKGFGSLGWAVVSDTSPKQIAGLSGGLFNTFGNIAAITTPIVIGYIVQCTARSMARWCSSAPTRSSPSLLPLDRRRDQARGTHGGVITAAEILKRKNAPAAQSPYHTRTSGLQ